METNKYFLFIFLILLFIGCDSGLERFPLDRPSDGTFLTTEVEMEMAITGAYATLKTSQDYNYPAVILLDCLTDIGWERARQTYMDISTGKHDSNNELVASIWGQFYAGIGRCNFITENISRGKDNVSENVYNRILAEAKFIRAFHYFWLMELFGDVPFTIKPINDIADTQLAKSSKNEIVSFLLSDLEEAAQYLPESIPASELGRASKGAALALRTKIALHNNLWQEAINSALKVMALDYELATSYEALFKNSQQRNTKEVLFSLQYLYQYGTYGPDGVTTRMGRGYSSKIPSQSLIDSYECIDGLPIDKSPLYDPTEPFKNRDPRLDYSCVVPGSVFFGYQFETHKDSVECWNYNTNPPTRVPNQDALNAYASFSGYCWRKYAESIPNLPTVGETPIMLLRYADVLLMYAEAKIEANDIDSSVYKAINDVRERVNMPPVTEGKSQQELRAAVRRERKYEFAFEGSRLFDIRRWGIAEKVMPGNFLGRIPKGLLATAPTIDEYATPDYSEVPNWAEMRVIEIRSFNKDRDYLLPIPRLEVETNKLLIQNKGY
ncbi:SusD family [Proteiniphilum saccharofermentans]|uniref:SusD family n=1 Tax=Proteiniphilum saccharofermentans TaxID=1642647 RepID=A0A1R3T936_9BACT|nr:RagB/SusD family nutrient uptake outer membrane protein [Proteiniphilum saccharofermentans]SCD20044.1 SusD family [Proteiniphilum saccharofermentans]